MLCLLQYCQGFYTWLVIFLIILDHSLLLSLYLINYGSRLGYYLSLYHRSVKCQPLSWLIIFTVIQQPLVSTLLCHKIRSIEIWQIRGLISLSGFQTAFGAAACVTVDTNHLISYIRVTPVDTVTSLWGSDQGVIAASELHESPIQIHDILDSPVSKQIVNVVYILAYLFNSAARLDFPFHFPHNLNDTMSP